MILAIDASSSAIGYAVLGTSGRYEDRVRSGVISAPSAWAWSLRIRNMTEQLRELLEWALTNNVQYVVVEVPGTVQSTRKDGSRSGGMRYAMAVGAVLQACWGLLPPTIPVITVEAELWTKLGGQRGIKKPRRVAQLEAVDPTYDSRKDKGGDEADAIMLGVWWVTAYYRRGSASAECVIQLPSVSLPNGSTLTTGNLDWSGAVRPLGAVSRSKLS